MSESRFGFGIDADGAEKDETSRAAVGEVRA
jgi:hypothetical protein